MADKQYGTKPWVNQLTPSQLASANFILPYMTQAVKTAEGSDKYIKSEPTTNPQGVLKNSIINNFARWLQSGQTKPYVDFMGDRWAPLNVPNDPKNLNKNWIPNVKDALMKMLGPEEYKRWRKYNMVRKVPWYSGIQV